MIDGVAAANWLAGYGPVPVGYCLKYVWLAYKAQGASTGMSAGTAYQAWGLSDGKRPGDRNPPPGAAVWWGRRYDGNLDGDVTISLGGGRIAATDWPTGRTGITTIDAREQQIGRVYLGWTSSIFDCPINVAAGKDAAPTHAPSIPSEEDDMLALKITLPNGEHLATLAPGIFSGLVESDNPDWVKNVVRSDDQWTIVPDERSLQTLLHKHGIDLGCYRLAGLRDLEIRDARTGVWSRGGRWSATDAVLGALGKA